MEGTGEIMPTEDLAMSFRKVTRAGSLRIAREGFELVREVAGEIPDVAYREELVDAAAALLLRDASQFDVIVTTNMFGDILSDEATELSGSLGLAASLNTGVNHAMAQAQHGSAPSLAGQNVANPASLIGSSAMLFSWLGRRYQQPELEHISVAIQNAIAEAVREPQTRTKDLGGTCGTKEFAEIITKLALNSVSS